MRILGLNTQFDDLVCSGFEEEEFSSKLYPVNRTVGVLKNPTGRQAITLKFGQRIQAGIH